MQRGPEAEIDLAALRGNLGAIRAITANRPVIAVVKADAYGHGAAQVAKTLEPEGIPLLAVAFLSEAVELRESGISSPILVLFDTEDPALYLKYSLTPVIHSVRDAERFSKEALKRDGPIGVHLKLDTGMGRMGLNGADTVKEVLEMASLQGIRLSGLMSHFSDVSPGGLGYARTQLENFNSIKRTLSEKGIKPFCHMAASGSTLVMPESHLDGVRAGLILYGCPPFHGGDSGNLKPVMKVKSKISLLKRLGPGKAVSYDRTFVTKRDSLIAVVPVGYADGYHRALSNRAEALVRGARVPLAGRVCMDLTMFDVTAVPGVSEGDEVVLLGNGISHLELADWAGTNPYEIMTSLGSGARRRYTD